MSPVGPDEVCSCLLVNHLLLNLSRMEWVSAGKHLLSAKQVCST